jgi:hypothetical protein
MKVHENGTPQLRLNELRQMFSTSEYTSLFYPPEEKEWTHRVPTTDQFVTDRVLSWSYIAVLPPDEKVKLVEDIKDILGRGDGKVWINREEGTFQHPYKTLAVVSRKK